MEGRSLGFWDAALAVLVGNVLTGLLCGAIYYLAVQMPQQRAAEANAEAELQLMQNEQRIENDELGAQNVGKSDVIAPSKKAVSEGKSAAVKSIAPEPSAYGFNSPAELILARCKDPCSLLVPDAEYKACYALGRTDDRIAFLNAHLPAGMTKVNCDATTVP